MGKTEFYIFTGADMPDAYKHQIKQLLVECDDEFLPPLSCRNGTTQTVLNKNTSDTEKQGIKQYFDELIKQNFIIAKKEERITGFLSFIENYSSCYIGNAKECTYISTIIVDRYSRGQGIARSMYREILSVADKSGVIVATRTWSGNIAHSDLLNKLGFDICARIPDDRGAGIDTVYFCRSK